MAEFVKVSEMENYRGMLDELLEVESGLSSWECDFLDTLANWEGCFTIPQSETLQKIYDKAF